MDAGTVYSVDTILTELSWLLYKHILLNFKRPMVTICTTRFNFHKFYALPTQCI